MRSYRLLPSTFYLLPLVCLLCAQTGAVEVDGIAATVGDAAILRSEVTGEMHRFGAAPGEDYQTVLNRLIDRRLILKAAASSKMTMQEWVVENRIREIIESSFGGDRNQLVAALAREKLPYTEFRQRIKDDLIVGAMRWNAVDRYVTAPPAAMREEYDKHPERYMSAATTSAAVILLPPAEADRRGAVDEALREGAFADAARRFSADTHAKDGGLWRDIVPAEVFRPEICEALAKLKPGETSGWIDLGGWSFLLRKEGETAAQPRAFADAYDDVEANVRRARAKALYDRWLDLLRAETYIKVY